MIIGPPPKFHGTRDILVPVGTRDLYLGPLSYVVNTLRARVS
jgi:hypothetical protein